MAINTFQPIKQTISEVFSCEGIYKIPNYQRQYSWTNDQLDALWSDLYESYQNKTIDNDCYFLGSIVVVNDGKGYFELIDGQQRITTLMILMNVLVKDFPNINKKSIKKDAVDKDKIQKCIFFKGNKQRLQLQTDPKYDSNFRKEIISCKSFVGAKEPTKKELNLDDPKYKFINAALFFYKKLSELDEIELNEFVNYIFNSTNVIKIECTNQSFAIKLFQVLNDRGLDLSPSDIIKSYIIGKYDPDDEAGKQSFNYNWKEIEDLSNQYGFKIDDFVVFYEYYKLKSNPKRQVVDELRYIIQNSDVYELVEELHSFYESLKEVYESTEPSILSLRHISWKSYVMTALTSAYQVKYPENDELFKEIRRFFYISLIAGCTLNQIKQTSFNLIKLIVEQESLDSIKDELNKTILSKKMYAKVYDALDNDVYNEKFLKPLMLSLEYERRESINNSFKNIDDEFHMDHILPQAYKKNIEWSYIDDAKVLPVINGLGNMALLQDIKNKEALNCGFDKKIKIYRGQNKDGDNKSGITSFEFTRKIIENYDAGNKKWNIEQIEERKKYLIEEIENLLDIKREYVNLKYVEESSTNRKTGKSKWLYKGVFQDNAKLVRALIYDYIVDNNIKDYLSIPEAIRNFKMSSHELVIAEKTDSLEGVSYSPVEVNGIVFYVRSGCREDETNDFIAVLKKLYDFKLENVEDVEK